MKNASVKRTTIFFTLSHGNIDTLFNRHDAAPLHERQLDESFIRYIYSSAGLYGKYSRLQYRILCKEEDKSLVDPFMYALRRHFRAKETSRKRDFKSFRSKALKFIITGLFLVALTQGLNFFFSGEIDGWAGFTLNIFSVFSWVMFFKGIEIWVFKKRPILKEMTLFHKLARAEAVIVREKEAQRPESSNYEKAA